MHVQSSSSYLILKDVNGKDAAARYDSLVRSLPIAPYTSQS